MNNNNKISSFLLFIDLKFHFGYTCLHFIGGAGDEFRENCLFTNYELSTDVRIS